MRACFSSLGVTLVSVPDNSSFEPGFYLHPSSLFVVVWITFHLSIFLLAGQHHGTECEPDEKLLRRFLGAH